MSSPAPMSSAAPEPFTFFHSARRVIYAWDALDRLGELAREAGARRPAVVLDGFFRGGALVERVTKLLASATGGAPVLHFVPTHEPDTASIEACRDALAPHAPDLIPDLIVAIGGGSAMDTAKVARLGVRIYEVPISYSGRTYAEGKKIGWQDGVSALRCIVKYNFFSWLRKQ